jgi:hypothetical protein
MNYISSHQEKKDDFIESIDSKINFLVSLHRFLLDNEKMKSLNLEQLTEVLNSEYDKLLEGVDCSEKMFEIENLQNQIKVIKAEIKSTENPLDGLEVSEKRLQKVLLRTKINKILEDDNLSFIYQVRKNIDYILYIKKQYQDFEDLEEKDVIDFEIKIMDLLRSRLRNKRYGNRKYSINFAECIKEINLEGLHVHVILKNKAKLKSAFQGFNGIHFTRTPVIATFENSEEDTYIHEKNHLIYNFLEDHKIIYSDELVNFILNRISKKSKTTNELLEKIFENHSPVDDVISKIEAYKDSLNGEILADIDRIFSSRKIYGFYGHFINTVSRLKIIFNNPDLIDPEFANQINPTIEKLELNITKKINDISYLVFVANKYNLTEETKSAFILFKGDINKIKRYLRHKIGNDEYDSLPKRTPYENRILKSKAEENFKHLMDGIFADAKDVEKDDKNSEN